MANSKPVYYKTEKESVAAHIMYVEEHCNNVTKAYKEYGEFLCKHLSLKKRDLKERVKAHDFSKYSDIEESGYSKKFFPTEDQDKAEADKEFALAWLNHINENPHHPEHWTYMDDNMEAVIMDMDNISIAEMLLDWISMSYKFGGSCYQYYKDKGYTKSFSNNTRIKVETLLNWISDYDKLYNIEQ